MWNAGCRLRVTTSRVGQRITQVLYASAPRLRDITSCRCYTCSSKSLSWKYTMGQKNSLFHAFGYNSAENEPICMKSGTVWAKFWELALADFGRDPQSSDSLRGSRNVFCPVNNARFRRFPVRKILRRFNTTSIGEAVKTFETGENFSIRGRLKNAKNCSQNFQVLRLQAIISPQWLQIAGPFISIGNLRCSRRYSVAVTFAATGIIQSPMTSCSRLDHSVCQAGANSIRKIISGRRRCGRRGGGIAHHGEVWYLRLPRCCYGVGSLSSFLLAVH